MSYYKFNNTESLLTTIPTNSGYYPCRNVQYVSYNNANSAFNDIICGVPQGSILGPLLFLLYINDLPLSSPSSHFIIFADDINILFFLTKILSN